MDLHLTRVCEKVQDVNVIEAVSDSSPCSLASCCTPSPTPLQLESWTAVFSNHSNAIHMQNLDISAEM